MALEGITPETTVEQAVARNPGARGALRALGVDLCCGGALTLREASELRGIPLAELLRAVSGAKTSCSASCSAGEAHESAAPATLYRRFVIAALVCTMTLGATLGAFQLMALHLAIGSAAPAHARSHASFQVMGFVLLFIMGVSYHALPRFLGVELALEKWARRSFGFAIAGLLVKNYALFDPLVPFTLAALAVGTLLQTAAVVAWCGVLGATWRRAKPARELFHAYLAAGTLFWLAAVGFLLAGVVRAIDVREVESAWHWNEPHYLAALLGGAVLWVEGMFLRTAASFLGLKPPHRRLLAAALIAGSVGAVVSIAGAVAAVIDLRAAGLVVTGAGLVLFALGTRIFERRAADADPDRHLAALLRLAMGSAVLFTILAVLYAAPELAGVTMRSLVYDGARHALTLGFVTVTIFAMAGRILPVFAATPLRWRPLWAGGCYLIVLGIVLRETEVICGLGGPDWLLDVSGLSGFVAATGVCAASIAILGTLRRGARRPRAATGGPVDADSTVAAVLASSDRALEILVSCGFEMLRNPVLRATLSSGVTLREACAMRGVSVDVVLAKLRAAGPRRLPVIVS